MKLCLVYNGKETEVCAEHLPSVDQLIVLNENTMGYFEIETNTVYVKRVYQIQTNEYALETVVELRLEFE